MMQIIAFRSVNGQRYSINANSIEYVTYNEDNDTSSFYIRKITMPIVVKGDWMRKLRCFAQSGAVWTNGDVSAYRK